MVMGSSEPSRKGYWDLEGGALGDHTKGQDRGLPRLHNHQCSMCRGSSFSDNHETRKTLV